VGGDRATNTALYNKQQTVIRAESSHRAGPKPRPQQQV